MKTKILFIIALSLALALVAFATVQIRQVIKVLGVSAAVRQFAPEINKTMNNLAKHKDTPAQSTRVVTIMSIGVGKNSAIGAAQLMGRKADIDKVEYVASPEADLFGKEIRIRALIPVEKGGGLTRVPGVAVSGIVDLKL